MKDFIIVGNGLAAHVLAHYFYQHQISFYLIGNDNHSRCSRVAAGIWNPVVFKRMTKSWLAEELLEELHSFYPQCEKLLFRKFFHKRTIVKPFTEEQEKVLWKKKAAAELENFIDATIYTELPEQLRNCKISNGYGIVRESGYVNLNEFLNAGIEFFKEEFIDETFDHSQLQLHNQEVNYKDRKARNIIFCEGFRVIQNPYFSWIPLKPAKGEVLTISTSSLNFQNLIFNKNGFVIDLEERIYKVGATYNWTDLTDEPSEQAGIELKNKLNQMITGDYSVLKQEAGVRPSSIDRRPIIGRHPVLPQLYVFNGLGTKGVMLAPYFAKKFVHFFLQNVSLPTEVDLKRFYPLYIET